MRKTMIALGLGVAIAGFGSAASAQSTKQQRPDSAHRHGRLENAQGGRRGGFGPAALLRGITLSDAQKTQLQALRGNKTAQPTDAERQARRATMEKIRVARQKGDTATAKKLMADARVEMQREQQQRVAQIRAILTTDQQKVFDANVKQLEQRTAQRPGRNGALKRSGPSA